MDARATAPVVGMHGAARARRLVGFEKDPDRTRFICSPLSGDLFRLHDIDGRKKTSSCISLGILTHSEHPHGQLDMFAVAQLVEDNEAGMEGSFFMRRFLLQTGEWDKLVGLPSPLPLARRIHKKHDHKVLAFAGRLWWVDVSWGAITDDPFSDRPELRFVGLPRGSVTAEPVEGQRGEVAHAEVSQNEPFVLSSFVLDDDCCCWTLEHRVALSRILTDGGYPWQQEEDTPRIGVIDPLNASIMYLTIGNHAISVDMGRGKVLGVSLLSKSAGPLMSFSGFFTPCVLPPWLPSSRIPSVGFRFHPTDEELVDIYLKRKVQQKPLSIELIKQLDIYKYYPWDLPKHASTREKEWYFYCPRDRKYRNSARPNRVTGAGFWKATGTDRPIYSSEGTKCIGLKKSLVFYRGRAAKGIKTDWMMHEYRLPSLNDPALPKTQNDKNIPASDTWAICRVFKKPSSVAQRVLSHSWGLQSIATTEPELLSALQSTQASPFALESSCSANQFNSQQYLKVWQHQKLDNSQDGSSCKVINFNHSPSLADPSKKDIQHGPIILPFGTQAPQKSSDVTSVLLSKAPGILDSMNEALPNTEFRQLEPSNGYTVDWATDTNGGTGNREDDRYTRKHDNEYSSGNECGIS